MLILRDIPNLKNEDSWARQRRDGDRSVIIFVWPADDGAKFVRVRVGVMALGDYDGHPLGINDVEIEAALVRHRDLIQRLAQDKHRAGDDEVTLDVGDFPVR
jgi:hypothetical protein